MFENFGGQMPPPLVARLVRSKVLKFSGQTLLSLEITFTYATNHCDFFRCVNLSEKLFEIETGRVSPFVTTARA